VAVVNFSNLNFSIVDKNTLILIIVIILPIIIDKFSPSTKKHCMVICCYLALMGILDFFVRKLSCSSAFWILMH